MAVDLDRPWLLAGVVAESLGLDLGMADAFRDEGSGPVTVTMEGRAQEFRAEWSVRAPAGQILSYLADDALSVPRLIIVRQIAESTARALRRRGICYLDLQGNAFVRFPGVHLRVSGARGLIEPSLADLREESGPFVSNLFSPARAQVVFAILQWPDLLEASARELAAVAGTSTGIAHGVRSDLLHGQYLDANRGGSQWHSDERLASYDALLDAWAAAFPTGLWRRIFLGHYDSDLPSWSAVPDDASHARAGGELALIESVVPQSVTVYLKGSIEHDWRARHRLRRASERPNTTLCRKFWTEPETMEPTSDVPWLLTYAEMLSRPDPRLRAAAEELRARARG